jgi:hypothetical protein
MTNNAEGANEVSNLPIEGVDLIHLRQFAWAQAETFTASTVEDQIATARKIAEFIQHG